MHSDPTQFLPGMQLMHYFPLYMHETDSGVIPDMVQSPLQNHLSLSTSVLEQNDEFLREMLKQSVLKTVDPNVEQRFLSFSMKGEELAKDLPYFDRSFFIKFDIISSSDSQSVIFDSFQLFEYNLINKTNSAVKSVRINCGVTLYETMISGESSYEGSFTLVVETNDPDGTFRFKTIGYFPVSVASPDNHSLYNLHSGSDFFKTKYKNSRFYYVLKPQGLFINVSELT
jgi:hypothetical protein